MNQTIHIDYSPELSVNHGLVGQANEYVQLRWESFYDLAPNRLALECLNVYMSLAQATKLRDALMAVLHQAPAEAACACADTEEVEAKA